MHALLVTFRSTQPLEELRDQFRALADPIAAQPGLVAKAWLAADGSLGGFYVFEDRARADAYLAGEIMAQLPQHPAFSGLAIDRYDVDDELSARTGLAPVRA